MHGSYISCLFCQRAFRTHSPVGPHRPVGYGLLSPVCMGALWLPLHPSLVPRTQLQGGGGLPHVLNSGVSCSWRSLCLGISYLLAGH